ncbi:MAG: hypothetical protein AUJ56_10250 [Zetaproteobacteria bacterium CG1_02_49_23]|nr:MAG: hypothetical protein AUJ56_10250 [Zetaproteobacteria bacterium CG1_02_49_23]
MMNSGRNEEQNRRIQALEQQVRLLEEALKQSSRIRDQWHEANRQLTASRQALKNSETLHRQVTNSSFDAILIVDDDDGTICTANPAAVRIFGYPAQAWEGMNIAILIPQGLELKRSHLYQNASPREDLGTIFQQVETEALHNDGHAFPIELTLSVLDTSPPRLMATVRDISERKRFVDELENRVQERTSSLKKLSEAVEQAPEAILITDCFGTIEYVNKTFTKFTGYEANEVIGRNPRILKSGQQDVQFYARMWETITSGQHWQSRVVERRKNGTFYPALLSISPIMDNEKNITHFVGYHQDMTDLQILEEQFHQAQKMEAVGAMVGGIAHEFNNMLAGITGNLYLAKFQDDLSQETTDFMNNIESLSFNAAEMIQQLLAFSRKGSVARRTIPLAVFCKETLKLQAISLPESITLRSAIAHDEMAVKGDPILLQQALINLINNARDAVSGVDDPEIFVEITPYTAEKSFFERHSELSVRHFARISITDNGCGVTPEQLEHIFEPFYTTKEVGKGTGLGLSMVYGAVRSHGGAIEVAPVEPHGACFHLYLPLMEEGDHDVLPVKADKIMRGCGETIMLVDDDESVLSTVQSILETLGYIVITACDGQEAVDFFEQHDDEVHLVLLDLMMPRLGGVDAAQLIKQRRPNIRILFATGYDLNKTLNMDIEESGALVLNKPFKITTLSQFIRRSLA